MAILTQQEVTRLVDAILMSGLDIGSTRMVAFQFINPKFLAVLHGGLPPNAQLMSDIGRMNQVERLANGDIPLQIYLNNMAMLLSGMPEQENVIRHMLELVSQRVSGAPVIDLGQIPETKEVLVHKDDTVPYYFMELGVKTAESVLKINVPAFENGQAKNQPDGTQIVSQGTGWLLSDSLVMTNHHVVNARKEKEADATKEDLELQGQNAFAIFDFNDKLLTGSTVNAVSLEAWNKELDYAIIRINATGRNPVKWSVKKITFDTEPVAVNIIQHPNGQSKRFGIRNNLVSASTETDLRYFTDTESGSSGSPVFNDSWEAVALHRGAKYVENVQFQGKSTAYVNVGTHLTSIFEHIKSNYTPLATELKI